MSEVWRPSRWTRQQMEERRLAALPMLSDMTLSSKTIAQRFGVSASTVRTWRQRLRHGDTLEATF
ncbi:helix-turn-helix domain-containing protein, partial [Deinococcus radiophilus]